MADRCSFCGSTAGPFSNVEGLFTVLMCADCQAAPRPRQRPLSGDDPRGDASRPEPDGDLGAGAEGGRQPPAHRGHAPTTGCRRAGGSHVPGAGAGLAGAPSRGRRGAGSSTEANNGGPPRIMTAWVGRLELRPASWRTACSRPHPAVGLHFAGSPSDRWCPSHSAGRRPGVYPACTARGGQGEPIAHCSLTTAEVLPGRYWRDRAAVIGCSGAPRVCRSAH
jgi:hypothetical protein